MKSNAFKDHGLNHGKPVNRVCLRKWIVIWTSENICIVGAMFYYIMHSIADHVIFTMD